MKKTLKNLFWLLVLCAFVYTFRVDLGRGVTNIKRQYLPCDRVVYYSLGTFDPKFDINREDFIKELQKATGKWNQAIGRELFVYRTDGKLKINLIYDRRQATTDKLSGLDEKLDANKTDYNELKEKYEKTFVDYQEAKANFTADFEKFTTKNDTYNQEVAMWNDKGGATPEIVQRLNDQMLLLQKEAEVLNNEQNNLNRKIAEVNALVDELNVMAKKLNLSVAEYNQVGGSGGVFEEGQYVSDKTGERIDIYEFDSLHKLHRVLMHEFGHAIGLGHVEGSDAIMYFMNSSKNEKITQADIDELKKVCAKNFLKNL